MRHVCAAIVFAIAACGGAQDVPAPPPPLRPPAEPKIDRERISQKDCEPTDPKHELKPISFDERSIPESTKLSEQARAELKTAESAEVDKLTRESYITDAVEHLLTALAADPYNVQATYFLAAAYARIDRPQCSINLLTRLLQMRPHFSKRADVELHLDKLLGRRQPLDPDFADMRDDERFRLLIRKMCEGTNDADCVYGAQKENRER